MTPYSPALDGLRGIAILLVLLHHFTRLDPVTPLDTALLHLPQIGWAGVDLFFVLSGFLITGILIDARGSDRYFSSFYARRTLRIFPLYYLVVILSLVVVPQFPAAFEMLVTASPAREWPYWLYLTNFLVAERGAFTHGILDVTWSLAIEEQFYIVWAVVVWLCPPRALGWLCLGILVAAPLARALALERDTLPIAVYVLPYFRADALAAGAGLAWLVRRHPLPDAGSLAARLALVGLAAVAAVGWIDGETWWWGPSMQRAGYSLLALTSGCLLVAALLLPATHPWPRMLSAGWLRMFGKYSYALYLIHLPVMRVVEHYVLPPAQFAAFGSAWLGQLVFYVAATMPALGLAWLSWRYFEAPLLRLKARFPY